MNKGSDDDEVRAATEASEWNEKLPDCSAQEKEKFAAWICDAGGPGHLREFLETQVLEEDLKNFDFKGELNGEALTAAALAVTAPPDEQREGRAVVTADEDARGNTPIVPHQPARTPSKMYGVLGGAAAAVLAVVIGIRIFYPHVLSVDAEHLYSTARGTDRTVTLEDGSKMYMSPGTTARARFSTAGRDVELTGGEAIFSVRHDDHSPFRVYVRDTVIKAVGTQFRVALRPDQALVGVIEGKVEISGDDSDRPPRSLSAGYTATVLADGSVVADDGARPSSLKVSQRSDPLIFNGSRLDEVAAAYNKRNWPAPRLVVEDGARSQTLFAIIPANDPELLVSILKSQPDLQISEELGTVVVRLRDGDGRPVEDGPSP